MMKNTSRWIGAMVGIAALIGATCALAQDWPQWRGINRDGKVAKFVAPKTWPQTLTQKWKVAVGTGDSTPALVGDKLYVFTRQGDDEVTLCLDAASSKEIWRDKYAAQAVTGAPSSHPGPRSSPVVANGRVVTLGVGGILSCLDAATGKLMWRKDEFPKVVPMFFTAMSPIITDKLCIAHLGGKGNGAVEAFELGTGNVKWKWTGDGPAYASPMVMTVGGIKQVVVQTEKNLIGLALTDGKLLWQIPTPVQGRFYNSATPIIDGQTVIYTGQGAGTRAVRIEKQGDAYSIKELWNNPQVGSGFSSPVLTGGLLFGINDKGSIFCLDAKTGQAAWIDTATRRENYGGIVDAGSVIFALPTSSELIAFKPNAKAYEEVARLKVAETPTYAYPIIAGKRVFIKDQESLALYMLP